ncbi:unnamed protein product [Mycena citricolor]|uniref:Uncharacterized protein n=1 Tax=Mycena citricolor TaxID=2018698 RepID=A0AAD2GY71_9AGAR|nr:unnamed protein product [Mycena citricolor]
MCFSSKREFKSCTLASASRHQFYEDIKCDAQKDITRIAREGGDLTADIWCSRVNTNENPHYELVSLQFKTKNSIICPTCTGVHPIL